MYVAVIRSTKSLQRTSFADNLEEKHVAQIATKESKRIRAYQDGGR